MDKKVDKQAIPNPLPTPEEPALHSFDGNDGNVKEASRSNDHEDRMVNAQEEEEERYSPHDEMEMEDTGATVTPLFQQDWDLFSERASEKMPCDTSCETSGPTGKPRPGSVETVYNVNPKKYLADCLSELAMFRQARRLAAEKAAAKEKAKPKVVKRQKVTRSQVAALPTTVASPLSPPQEVAPEFVTPLRPSRVRHSTPAPKQSVPTALTTPPPTVPRRPTPNRKVADTPKKSASKAPVPKKQKPSKTKPKSSINDKQDAIKARLNKRYEDQGMNTAGGKGAHWLFEDAYIPPLDLDQVSDPPPHERTEIVQKEVKTDDPCFARLHPKEVVVASWMRASASEYLTQKRRFFLGVVEWYRSGYPEVKRAHAQSFCNQDGNSTTYMHETFNRWGWFDRSAFPDEVLKNLPHLFGDNQANGDPTTATPVTRTEDLD